MNTIIMATLTLSQVIGVNVVVTGVPRRSDLRSKVTDDLSKGQKNTVWGFQGFSSRRVVAPEVVLS